MICYKRAAIFLLPYFWISIQLQFAFWCCTRVKSLIHHRQIGFLEPASLPKRNEIFSFWGYMWRWLWAYIRSMKIVPGLSAETPPSQRTEPNLVILLTQTAGSRIFWLISKRQHKQIKDRIIMTWDQSGFVLLKNCSVSYVSKETTTSRLFKNSSRYIR